VEAQDGQLSNLETYAIVSRNWKKDVLSFCRKLKEEIEFDPDLQLIRSSIATSHFDHAMTLISETSVLSDKVLRILGETVQSKQDFDTGKCPDFVIGLNKLRLKRFEGAPIEEFVVFIPNDYTNLRAWPVLLDTDTLRFAAKGNYTSPSGLIDIWWNTISNKDIRWESYRTVMNIIEQKINIDKNRIYVKGECRNGIYAMALALNYPDHFAECSVSLGNSYRQLAGNALNLPLIFVGARHHFNEDTLTGYYNFAAKCFQYHGCKYLKYSKTQTAEQIRGAPSPEAIREKSPQRVLYTIESLDNPKAYWVRIDGREDENLLATIDASVDGQSIIVKTSNIDAYSLDLRQAPLDSNKPVEIIENGQSIGVATNEIFTRRNNKKYDNAAYVKNEHIHGPVWDAFNEPYVVVWGRASKNVEFNKASELTAKFLANNGPCFSDASMPGELIETHNMILVGTPESNLWLSKIYRDLHVQMKEGQLIAGNKHYRGTNMGFILIHPNPFNPKRYVVIFTSETSKAMGNIVEVYSQMKSIRPADVCIFEITNAGRIKWHIMEKFNTIWGWHNDFGKVLGETNKKHPEWQWGQWVTRALRNQLGADAALLEDPLISDSSMPVGQITYRDLFNNFRNYWISTIRIKGKLLKAVLVAPFTDISKRKVNAPFIDGVSLIKNSENAGERTLAINELIDDKIYTIALPEKCINGQRIGLVLQDYDIVNQAHLLPMLKDYLQTNLNINMDNQLDELKPAIF